MGTTNLSSPFYPQQYPELTCVWFVTVPVNVTSVLRFIDFDIETRYDYLYLGYGDDADAETTQMLALKGGNELPPRTFRVETVTMWIKFTSEIGLLINRGFYVSLEAEASSGEFD